MKKEVEAQFKAKSEGIPEYAFPFAHLSPPIQLLTSCRPLTKVDPELRPILADTRLSKALQSMYLKPLRRKPTHGIAVCDLQLRSFSVRNLELYADFAMRAAYYLGLVARGPIPLPKITQRYTVIRSNFVHKKSQENFERVHLRRLIQIQDGDPVVVQCWLGYLQRKAYHGVGMKANIYEHEALGVGKRMDGQAGEVDKSMDEEWGNLGIRMNAVTAEKVEELLDSEALTKPRRDLEAFYREPIEIKRTKTA
jgi:ribosomal protein S10